MKKKKPFKCSIGFHEKGRYMYSVPSQGMVGYKASYYKCRNCGAQICDMEEMDTHAVKETSALFRLLFAVIIVVLVFLIYYASNY